MNGLKKPQVVVVPFTALGHFIPFLDLTRLLASNGLLVSYVTTPGNVSFLTWMEEQFHQQTTTPPMRIVYDIFMDWAIDMAQKFNVASVMFNTYGAFAISLMQSISSSIMQKMLGKDGEDNLVVNFNLPRPLRLSKHEVCPDFVNPDLSNSIQLFVYQCFQKIGKGSVILINTFHELEPFYV
ncbi:hypothetical protein SUGI_0073900 [Cryptomeria japonica]|nr:hypothetical protein SUGI_0073900 [Cryptomeria japonica]